MAALGLLDVSAPGLMERFLKLIAELNSLNKQSETRKLGKVEDRLSQEIQRKVKLIEKQLWVRVVCVKMPLSHGQHAAKRVFTGEKSPFIETLVINSGKNLFWIKGGKTLALVSSNKVYTF